MLWAAVAAGAMGMVLGMWFRVPAVAAASGGVVLVFAVAAPWAELSLVAGMLMAFALVTALQGGYLVGAIVSVA